MTLSIIICSRTVEINPILSSNIDETIGVDYELIVIDNSENKHSIFEAYNLGISKSKGNFCCFIHDDIFFHNRNWGKIVQNIFEQNSKIGLIGVAGTKVKTRMPSAWWDCPENVKSINIIQHLKSGHLEHWEKGWEKKIEEVVAIDGVFMAARRPDKIHFSNTLTGFHNYDLNLSFEYLKHNYKIVVAKEILIEHFSVGTINPSWYRSVIKIHDMYADILPLELNKQSDFNLKKLEFDNGSKFLLESFKHIKKTHSIKIWFRLLLLKPKSKLHFKFLKLFLR
ncbi:MULTISPECIES: glycosyltransferase [unclassified Flavobacterium]|uniref:glycosyltransferase n=1 Tax=unclassified Flavobacterium TaxID=196869 RepID=UPI0006ABEA38|nr:MULTISPECIES: glycosyltransferase [unclassified Flavobacterium]KOP39507.1 hypothetical protein AKO67_05285 [Flavobacterium sp. VMW]OWU91793.1 hypothetical protein APR43_06810 [Flavobacterium sp. NLM]